MMRLARALVLMLAAGCGSGSDPSTPPDTTPDAPAVDEGFQTLLEGGWNLGPGEEGYFCVYATIPRDIYIKAFRPINPPGTHHSVLTLYQGASPADGIVPCGVGTNGQSMIYGSGIGAPDFVFPTGVGLHLPAGTRLLLNLHLYNATDTPLSESSGTLFEEATASEIQHLAELVLAGPTIGLSVPTGMSTQTGTCRLDNITDEPLQLFALSQHMHRLGRNVRSVITRGDAEITLQDIPYDFEKQEFHLVDPMVELLPGDVLTTHCTYDNTTGATVPFGDSSDDEMCFTDLFYYPAQGASFICSF